MIAKTATFVILVCLSIGLVYSQDGSSQPPEEPDFFFLTGGPYTQQKNSPQLIWAHQWLHSRTASLHLRDLSGAGRVEFGVSDNLEADFEFGATSVRQEHPTYTLIDTQLDGMMLGARYRILREDFAPLTLTVGPQLLIPTRTSAPWETGLGYGVDVTAAKDWGGPVFTAASVNWRNTPGVRPTEAGEPSSLRQVSYAVALGLRPVEAVTRKETKHDLHAFVEMLSTTEDAIDAGEIGTTRHIFAAPGIRYGFTNRAGILAEIGIAFPLGLNREAPNWGTLLQLQIELPGIF
ncbi:MAG: hypothetical protein EHM61_10560 [Acidobacteria bacterium]|nr:MAG: hypothetical protein EHM61_10560 [Acidobacteriota bacterium]